MIEVAIQRHDMIRAPVRVRVAASKIACKQCGREYTTGDLAMLTLCETCGSQLVRGGVVIETVQHIITAQRPPEKVSAISPDVDQLAARISVKRHGARTVTSNAIRDMDYSMPAAAWVKVA